MITQSIAADIKSYIDRNGYECRVNSDGFVVVKDPVYCSARGHLYEEVTIKSWTEAARFVGARS